MGVQGTIYLICLERSLGGEGRASARHYLGWTNGTSVASRLEEHRSGKGAKMLAYASDHGIGFDVVRTWKGDRHMERRFKKGGHFAMKCPNCQEKARRKMSANSRAYLRRRRERDASEERAMYDAFDEIPF